MPGGPPSPGYENETAATQVTGTDGLQYEYVAYNADDPGPIYYFPSGYDGYEDRVVCPPASITSYSYSVAGSNSWQRVKVWAPGGYSLLWGDPAMTSFGNTVFLSTMAAPDDAFQAKVNWDTDVGCIRFSSAPGSIFALHDATMMPPA